MHVRLDVTHRYRVININLHAMFKWLIVGKVVRGHQSIKKVHVVSTRTRQHMTTRHKAVSAREGGAREGRIVVVQLAGLERLEDHDSRSSIT